MKEHAAFYFSLFWRRIHWFALVAVSVTVAAVFVARELPPVYTAQARLLVERAQIEDATVTQSPVAQLQVIRERLQARATLLAIARAERPFEDMDALSPDEIVGRMREGLDFGISTGRGEATIMRIDFTAASAPATAGVLNELLDILREEDARRRTGAARETLAFYDEEVRRLSTDLSEASAAILAFQEENAESLPGSLSARLTQQGSLQEQILQIDRDIAALDRQSEQMLRLFESTGSLGTGEARATPAQRRLADLQRELDSALLIYSAANPRVRVLQERLAQAEAEVAAEAGAAPAEAGDDAPDRRDVMFELQMEEMEQRRSELEARRSRAAARLEELEGILVEIPGNTVVLDALERDYAAVRDQYNEAVRRQADAATGERIEALSRGQRIVVTEPPAVPSSPSSPNRPLIVAAGAGAGVAAGLGLVILLELLDNSVRRPRDLTNRMGITPLATIPFVPSRGRTIRRRLYKLAFLCVALVGVPALLWFVDTEIRPLELVLRDLRGRIGL
ncbi:MAG: Wzz/FepE/Etk N-terminal domain-containing protein [Hasllibacter sp.]